ncbi:iron-sulfur cluster assembly accessory protein [[Leptolyngbya] sp. PCC 7376]|uniref:HesB/IscA family protein n=1 Tax=[Leptolyngbya] sp. PCC 7376 TaxID=111781 RepID=UPI00029EC378|nr:iron-sulfur cluster assembly accessory protein [[Leptolyngbya] sp. PCC 7376]AFY38708.1 iron-sulfur cluster assembly accessory protein [[Leptolyngbya] sp. PCC 7376]
MIQITPTAAQEIKRIQRSRNVPDSFLRLSIAKGGCLDFIYQFSLEMEPQEGDRQYSSRNIKILVDPSDETSLADLNLDFSEDLMGGGFRFSNPIATKICNCGQSFQTSP